MKTLREISKKTGISIATFSRVLNGGKNVSEEMKKKVLKALKENDYHRTFMMGKNIKSLIGIIIPNFRGYHYSEIASGIEEILIKNDYQYFIASSQQRLSNEISVILQLYERKADGIILCTSEDDDLEIKNLLNCSIPVVGVDRKDSEINIDSVGIDNFNSTLTVAKYLYQKGHRKILFVSGDKKVYSSHVRKEAFEYYSKEKKDMSVQYVEGDFDIQSGYLATKKAFEDEANRTKEKITAIFFSNDGMAYGGLRALHECGLKVPEDISIISFDDSELSKYTIPSLTTIVQPRYEIGNAAGQLLINRIEGKEKSKVKRKIYLRTKLIERESVKDINKTPI